jgi:hypothetical protein
MKFRKLRIAWSVFSGVACVLLIVFWVRSYKARDQTRGVISSHFHLYVTSLNGEIAMAADEWPGKPHPWIFESKTESYNMVAVLPDITGKPPLSWIGLRWYFKPNLWVLVSPHWLAAALAAVVGVIPWAPFRRRFSLRTLLIAATLVAVVLGVVVYAASH